MGALFTVFILVCVGKADDQCVYSMMEVRHDTVQACERTAHLEGGRLRASLGTGRPPGSVVVECRPAEPGKAVAEAAGPGRL